MNSLTGKFLSRGSIAAVGLSAIALLGAPEMAKAADITAGTDYLFTPLGSDTRVDFGFGNVFFTGVPVLPGGADTAVTRLDDCTFDLTGQCTVDIQFTDLNLMSVDPVPQFGNQTVFLMLDDDPDGDGVPDAQPISSMTLTDNLDGTASWENTLDFSWKLVDANNDPIFDLNNDPIKGFEQLMGKGIGEIDGDNNFKVLFFDDYARIIRHTNIPEPSATLAALLVGLGSIAGLKRKGNSKKS